MLFTLFTISSPLYRLFEMGLAEQIKEILERMPDRRQTVLFSATLPSKLVEFAKAGLNNPTLIRLDTELTLSENLRNVFFTVRAEEKISSLLYMARKVLPEQGQAVVFAATRYIFPTPGLV